MGFWNDIQNTIQDGASQFIQNETDRLVNPAKPPEAAPQADVGLAGLQAALASQKNIIMVVFGLIVVAVLFTSTRGRRRG